MKVTHVDLKRGVVAVVPETSDDIWLLSLVIKPGDYVKGKTVRDVRFGERGSGRSRRVAMVLTIRVENVEFQPFSSKLRIRGVVVEGPERFGVKGKHHTITVDVGQEIVIVKEEGWPRPLLERLQQASRGLRAVLAAVDYDEYAVAVLQGQGVRIVVDHSMSLPGKDDPRRGEILHQELVTLAKKIVETAKKEDTRVVVIGGPGFLKERVAELVRQLDTGLRVYTETAATGGVAGVYEIIRRGKIREILGELAALEAEEFLEKFERLLVQKPELVTYTLDHVERAAEMGAIEELLVLDELLHSPDPDVRIRVEEVLRKADATRAKIRFVSLETPAGLKLKSFGGIAAILRYPVEQVVS
ncbi:translation factor pelota [Pyrolobus fumarii 1A]|uniref:Protein pelota homolog n=1 Tax=Pyrolobus fumarii (strain DSM 11204 / 1A) TaxID=694429 RepID=G0EFC6_PYRF1|nr:mRNA surveillance protein pelota [Pyrolobus fumarii]AEM38169.1 translation factor pelota [Pyrolobus fumarii 1A]